MAKEVFFTPEVFEFLKDLKKHNDREWFQANKDRYSRVVRDPMLAFIAAFASRLEDISEHFVADPRPVGGSMFRIYRDTRFAKDKSPYKTHAAAHFPHRNSGEGAHAPGFYLHLEPGQCFAGAGLWRPDTPTLTKIRSAIVQQPKTWQAIRGKLKIEGESLSRPPKGFDPAHPFIDDLKRKDFVTTVTFTDSQVCGPKFLTEFAAACKKMAPLVEFLTKAEGLKW